MSEVAIERSLFTTGIGSEVAVGDGIVPIIDMSGNDVDVAEHMVKAANDVGFFSIINHGMDQGDIDAMFKTAECFFSQSLTEKKKQSPFEAAQNSGFEYF